MLFVAYTVFALWLYLLLGRGGFWRTDTAHAPGAPSSSAWPDICVIIPARNEADILDQTLPSLLADGYPGSLQVILVDDRSEDATSSVAGHIAEGLHASAHLTVVKSHALPGWKGKVAAMHCGLEHVASQDKPPRYVLFTDADIRYDAGALMELVAHAETSGLVLASLMVKLRCVSAAERWLIPAFVYFFQLLYPFSWVNDPERRTAAAAGGCMLVRYDALMGAGGLESIRTALIDDCAMGRLMKKQGPVSLSLTRGVHSLRAYPRISDIHAMVARSAYDQLDYSPLNLIGALLGMIATYIAPVLLAFFAGGTAQLLGIASWALMSLSFLPMQRFYGCSPLHSLTLPAIAAVYMGFTLDSALQYRRGRGGLWKGRVQAGARGA